MRGRGGLGHQGPLAGSGEVEEWRSWVSVARAAGPTQVTMTMPH